MRVLVIDDHPSVSFSIGEIIRRFAPGSEVLTAARLAEALDAAQSGNLDLVVFDLSLPDARGIGGLKRFREAQPDLPVVVYSASDDRATILGAIDAGAMGFVPKSSSWDVFTSAVRIVLSGTIYIPPEALTGAIDAPAAGQATAPADLGLTPRQYEVMERLLLGQSNKRICQELDIAESTVKIHMTAVLRALRATNRTQAVIHAARLGIQVPISRGEPDH